MNCRGRKGEGGRREGKMEGRRKGEREGVVKSHFEAEKGRGVWES